MNRFLYNLRRSFSNQPKYRKYRDKGDELFKQKQYSEALEQFLKSYKHSIKEADSSLTILNRVVKTADKLNDKDSVEIWIDEFDKLKNHEGNRDYAIFGKVKLYLSINRVSEAIIELNKMNPNKMSYYDFHLKHKYYQICYRKEKLIKTQLHHCILKRMFLLAHHNETNEILNQHERSVNIRYKEITGKDRDSNYTEETKDSYNGSIFLHDEKDKEIIKLYNRGKFKLNYQTFKSEIDEILNLDYSFIDKINNLDTNLFNDYFKNIE